MGKVSPPCLNRVIPHCTGLHPDHSWISPGRDTPQPLQAMCSSHSHSDNNPVSMHVHPVIQMKCLKKIYLNYIVQIIIICIPKLPFIAFLCTTNNIHHIYKLMYWMTKVQKSQYTTEEHQIWLTTWTTAHGREEKKWFLRLWPWENSILLQYMAIISTLSTWRTRQLNVSFPVLWCTSEYSTQDIVLWLILTASEEGNQLMGWGKNIIFLIFLHFVTYDLK